MNTLTVGALLSLAVLSSACDGGASSPTSPTPTGPTPTATVTYAVSGTVLETTSIGSTPIERARVVDVSSGRFTMTDTQGRFSIPDLPTKTRSISVTKPGYVTQTTTATVDGEIQLAIRLERMVSYTLSGMVYELTETGQVPIEGVEVYCDSCGSPDGHTFVYTDADGFYSLPWTFSGVHPLIVKKVGYEILGPRHAISQVSATVHGDTRLDIELARQ